MKAAHIVRTLRRAEEVREMMGTNIDCDRELWVNRMAEAIRHVRGSDRVARNPRRAVADSLWLLVYHDFHEVAGALLDANRLVRDLRELLRRNGVTTSPLLADDSDSPASDGSTPLADRQALVFSDGWYEVCVQHEPGGLWYTDDTGPSEWYKTYDNASDHATTLALTVFCVRVRHITADWLMPALPPTAVTRSESA